MTTLLTSNKNRSVEKPNWIQESEYVKKTVIAALASLMLAGMLCTVDGSATTSSGGGFVIIADGGGPVVDSSQLEAPNDTSFGQVNPF